MTHAGRRITVNVTANGDGLLSHVGSACLAQVADRIGLTRALGVAVGEPGLWAGSHDRGPVIRDLAVMLTDGGDCLADLRAVSDQGALFGSTASPSTAFRVIDRIATTPGLLDALGDAHPRACAGPGTGWRAGAVDDRSGRHPNHRAFREGPSRGHVQGRLRICADARLCGRDRRGAARRVAPRQRRGEQTPLIRSPS